MVIENVQYFAMLLHSSPIVLCAGAASVCCCTMKDGKLLVDPSSAEEQVGPACNLLELQCALVVQTCCLLCQI